MMRLIILTGPIASALCGVAIGQVFDWCQSQYLPAAGEGEKDESESKKEVVKASPAKSSKGAGTPGGKGKKGKAAASSADKNADLIAQVSQ